MGQLDISKADYTNTSNITYADSAAYGDTTLFPNQYKVLTWDTDGATGFGETTYDCDWPKWHGYYRYIPEFQAVIDKLASWTVGRGFKADTKTMAMLKKIKGFGKDDFNSLLENFVRTFLICGDCFAEVMKDKAGRLVNLKPLSPGSIRIVTNESGIIVRYEQYNQLRDVTKVLRFRPNEMLHFSWNRIADEIHGIPFAEKLEKIIEMRNEAMQDMRVVFHRYVKPLIISKIDSDDATEIANYKTKLDRAVEKCENLIIPKDTVEMERMSVPQYSTLDPLPWLKYLVRQFVTACGVPEVIMGWGEETTEASSKIIYLAFQQTIERLQRYVESQLESQINIKINLEFPASIEPEVTGVKEDNAKDPKMNKFGVDPRKDQK